MPFDWITEPNQRLYADLTLLDERLPAVLEGVMTDLSRYDATLPVCWDREGITERISTYLLRYVTPFHELRRAEGLPIDIRPLSAELLSCCAWRAFDNCMDAHQSHKVSHLASLLGYARLIDYTQRRCGAVGIADVQEHYCVMAEHALREEDPLALEDEWQRCSLLFYPVESLGGLLEGSITLFRRYVTYCGLAHDLTDVVADTACQIMTLPVVWLRQINDRRALAVSDVVALYAKAREEVGPIEDYFVSNDVEKRLPLIGRLCREAYEIFRRA